MTYQQQIPDRTLDRQRDVAQSQILLAMILARQGKSGGRAAGCGVRAQAAPRPARTQGQRGPHPAHRTGAGAAGLGHGGWRQGSGVARGGSRADRPKKGIAPSLSPAKRTSWPMEKRVVLVKNGHIMMANIVGTGCMATSVIGTFAAVEKDFVGASVAGLVCYEVAAEKAAAQAEGPGSFKEKLFDAVYNLDAETVERMQRIEE